MSTLTLTNHNAKQLITIADCMEAVQSAYMNFSRKKVGQPPIVSFNLERNRHE